MRRADVLIGLVLVSAVVLSAVGLMTYDRAPGPLRFEVTWMQEVHTEDVPAESRAGVGEILLEAELSRPNMTDVEVKATVTASGPRVVGAIVRAWLAGPNMTPMSTMIVFAVDQRSGSQEIRFDPVHLQDSPASGTVLGNDTSDAAGIVERGNTTSLGNGTWSIRLVFSGSNPQGLAPETFGAFAEMSVTSYRAVLTPRLADVPGAR